MQLKWDIRRHFLGKHDFAFLSQVHGQFLKSTFLHFCAVGGAGTGSRVCPAGQRWLGAEPPRVPWGKNSAATGKVFGPKIIESTKQTENQTQKQKNLTSS